MPYKQPHSFAPDSPIPSIHPEQSPEPSSCPTDHGVGAEQETGCPGSRTCFPGAVNRAGIQTSSSGAALVVGEVLSSGTVPRVYPPISAEQKAGSLEPGLLPCSFSDHLAGGLAECLAQTNEC